MSSLHRNNGSTQFDFENVAMTAHSFVRITTRPIIDRRAQIFVSPPLPKPKTQGNPLWTFQN
jgi:hypothetical protein